MRRWIAIGASAIALAGCASSAPIDTAGAGGSTSPETASTGTASTGTASSGTASAASTTASVAGTVGGIAGVPSPFRPGARPSIAPGGPLTEAANGGHVTLRLGAHIAVRLDPPNAAQAWDQLVVSPSGVVQVQDQSGGYPTREPLTATLVATSAGTVTVTSQSDQACLHATPRCLPPQFGWSVQLTITA